MSSTTILVSERGQITLPLSVRKKYALGKNTPLILDETKEGLLLRKVSMIPMKPYSDEEIQALLEEDTVLAKDKKWIRKKTVS